jgi:hypothetical protein
MKTVTFEKGMMMSIFNLSRVRMLSRCVVTALSAVLIHSIAVASENKNPLKVFILVGQSNMQGHAHVRTLEHVGMDPKTAPLLRAMQGDDGMPRVFENISISSLSNGGEKTGALSTGFGADENKIGPELTFGIYMQRHLDEPILIIKTAWGGKSLNTDFRSPSAGGYEFNDSQIENLKKQGKDLAAITAAKVKATGHFYRQTIEHVRTVLSDIKRVCPEHDEKSGYELAGLVWFQGWNDMVDRGTYPNRDQPGGYDRYTEALVHFIRDVRRDLSAPELPFVIGVFGVGGPVDQYLPEQRRYAGIHQNFRLAMAAPALMPEFRGNTAAVLTETFWDMELHGLRAREAEVKQKVKVLQSEQKLSGEGRQAALRKYQAEEFTRRETEVLQKGVSNAEYHYLGSAKIMAQIGQGFADAMARLLKD